MTSSPRCLFVPEFCIRRASNDRPSSRTSSRTPPRTGAERHARVPGTGMALDVRERPLRDAEERHAAVAVEVGEPRAPLERDRDASAFGEQPGVGAQRRNEAEVVEERRAQLPGELVDLLHRALDELLGQRDRLGDAARVGRRTLLERGETYVDARQRLTDRVVQVATDPEPLLLVRGEEPTREMAQPSLHLPRALDEVTMGDLAGGPLDLQRLAPRDLLGEPDAGGGELARAAVEGRVEPPGGRGGLEPAAVDLLDRQDRLREERLLPRRGARRRERRHGSIVDPRERQRADAAAAREAPDATAPICALRRRHVPSKREQIGPFKGGLFGLRGGAALRRGSGHDVHSPRRRLLRLWVRVRSLARAPATPPRAPMIPDTKGKGYGVKPHRDSSRRARQGPGGPTGRTQRDRPPGSRASRRAPLDDASGPDERRGSARARRE